MPTARRAHLIAKAKQLSEQRAQRQQQEIQRLAQLQASLSTSTQSFSPSPHAHLPLSHELDPLIAADDALHTRYLLHTQQLQRKLDEQQDSMQQLSLTILRLQQLIETDYSSSTTQLTFSPSFYQQENSLLQSHLTLLGQRLQQREEEAALLTSLITKKSQRINEVREEATVVADEMRAAVRRLGADKERRVREMREEREQLTVGLREMIDRCVRENEWMRLRLGEEGRDEMERWKASEESSIEQREQDRQRVLQKEREREKQREAERQREEQLQLQRLEEERQREEKRRQQEAEAIRRLKEEEVRKQQEELKQPEPEPEPVTASVLPETNSHFISRPSAMLTASSSSANSSPASVARRVHFRHPSASPTVYYEPAPPSAPPSPMPLLPSTTLHSQSSLIPPLPVQQYRLPNPTAPHNVTQFPQSTAAATLSYPMPALGPPSSVPYPLSSAAADAAEFDSYFGHAADQQLTHQQLPHTSGETMMHQHELQQHAEFDQHHRHEPGTPSTPDAAKWELHRYGNPQHPSTLNHVTPVQHRAANGDVGSISVTQAAHYPPAAAAAAASKQASQPASSSSISDRVMGRIGGWMLGSAGRERMAATGPGSSNHVPAAK